MVSLPTSSDEDIDYDFEETPFEEEHKGFPAGCFCGGEAILEKKKWGPDTGRLYYRCSLSGETDTTAHLGKWFDTAVEEEWRMMRADITRLEYRGRVDDDYIERLSKLETLHAKMNATMSALADEVQGWADEFTFRAADSICAQMGRETLSSRVANMMRSATNRSAFTIAVALVTSFVAGWWLRELLYHG